MGSTLNRPDNVARLTARLTLRKTTGNYVKAQHNGAGKTKHELSDEMKEFRKKNIIKIAMIPRHDSKRLKVKSCDFCSFTSMDKQKLLKHRTQHRDAPGYTSVRKKEQQDDKCKFCSTETKTLKELREHYVKDHGGNLPYMCEVCSKGFIRIRSLSAHKRKTHGSRKTPVASCKFCSKSFTGGWKELREHYVNDHGGNLPYMCEVCSKGFLNQGMLSLHTKRAHGSGLVASCKFCSKSVTGGNKKLREHYMKDHGGILPDICKICSKGFLGTDLLKRHKNEVHTEIFTHQCGICQAKFKNSRGVIQHIATHYPEPTFGCTVCHVMFKSIASASNHVKAQHNGAGKTKTELSDELKEFRKKYIIKIATEDNSKSEDPLEKCSRVVKQE